MISHLSASPGEGKEHPHSRQGSVCQQRCDQGSPAPAPSQLTHLRLLENRLGVSASHSSPCPIPRPRALFLCGLF